MFRFFFITVFLSITTILTGGETPAESDNVSREGSSSPRALFKPTPLLRIDSLDSTESSPSATIVPLKNSNEEEELRQVLEDGKVLLQTQQWPEARLYFEKASRKYPKSKEIERCFVLARCSVELNSRYRDPSYRSVLKDVSLEEVKLLYNEIMANIQTWHVDTPNWQALMEHGLDGLDLAFTDPLFLSSFRLSSEQSAVLHEYCDLLRDASRRTGIRSEEDLRNWVFKIAERLSERTNITENAVVLEFICSITCSLDPWSSFLTPGQISDVYSMIDGHFVGLGVELKTDGASLLIVRVIPNSPADSSGLKVGERIIRIDGKAIEQFENSEQSGSLLQGKEGTFVHLDVLDQNQQIRIIDVERRRVDVPSVENVQILTSEPDNERVGYVRISCFQKTTAAEMAHAIQYLEEKQMQCLIVDLRQNPGGLLQEAIEVCNLFLDKGVIVRTRGRFLEKPYYAKAKPVCSLPLLVLIDGNSASASEIFAGAIQGNHRGRIIGTRSYGKGTVQALIRLKGTGPERNLVPGLRLTTEKFYSPSGKPYSNIGVEPDVTVQESVNTANRSAESYHVARPISDAENKKWTEYQKKNGYSQDPWLLRAWSEARQMLLSNRAEPKSRR